MKNEKRNSIVCRTPMKNDCEKFPISIMSVLFYGEYDHDAYNDQRYSTYLELDYSNFIDCKKVSWAVGMTPAKGSYADKLILINIGMTVYDNIKFKEQNSLPVRAGVSLNPVQEKLLLSFLLLCSYKE